MVRINGRYTFQVTAWVTGNTQLSSSAVIDVTVKPSPLFAAIAGGTTRAQSVSNPLFLDGSHSYDPDNPGAIASRYALIPYQLYVPDVHTSF